MNSRLTCAPDCGQSMKIFFCTILHIIDFTLNSFFSYTKIRFHIAINQLSNRTFYRIDNFVLIKQNETYGHKMLRKKIILYINKYYSIQQRQAKSICVIYCKAKELLKRTNK